MTFLTRLPLLRTLVVCTGCVELLVLILQLDTFVVLLVLSLGAVGSVTTVCAQRLLDVTLEEATFLGITFDTVELSVIMLLLGITMSASVIPEDVDGVSAEGSDGVVNALECWVSLFF